MAEEVTLGEIGRALDQLRKDISDDFSQVRKDIAEDRTRFVSMEKYAAESLAQNAEIARIDARINNGVRWAMGILATIIGLQLWQLLQLKQAAKP